MERNKRSRQACPGWHGGSLGIARSAWDILAGISRDARAECQVPASFKALHRPVPCRPCRDRRKNPYTLAGGGVAFLMEPPDSRLLRGTKKPPAAEARSTKILRTVMGSILLRVAWAVALRSDGKARAVREAQLLGTRLGVLRFRWVGTALRRAGLGKSRLFRRHVRSDRDHGRQNFAPGTWRSNCAHLEMGRDPRAHNRYGSHLRMFTPIFSEIERPD